MAVSQFKDITLEFNAASAAVMDIQGWDWVVVQFVAPSGAVNFTHTNDGGEVTGSADGNARSAANFVAVQGTDLSTGTAATTTSTGSLYKFPVIGRFLKLAGSSVTATKILVHLSKIG